MAKTVIGDGYHRTVEALEKALRVEEGIKRMAENARRVSNLSRTLDKAIQTPSSKK